MPKDFMFVLKWVKSVIRCALYIFHLSEENKIVLSWEAKGDVINKFCCTVSTLQGTYYILISES